MLLYFAETSEPHVGYSSLLRHILRHLRHLLVLCLKSPFFALSRLQLASANRVAALTSRDGIL